MRLPYHGRLIFGESLGTTPRWVVAANNSGKPFTRHDLEVKRVQSGADLTLVPLLFDKSREEKKTRLQSMLAALDGSSVLTARDMDHSSIYGNDPVRDEKSACDAIDVGASRPGRVKVQLEHCYPWPCGHGPATGGTTDMQWSRKFRFAARSHSDHD